MRLPVLLAVVWAALLPPLSAGQEFAIVAFHDVVDSTADLDDDAVTTDRLIGFFEWLRGNRWTVISMDDVEAARLGKKPLPPRSILLSFDDGYRSHYTRVFPLLLAYRIPAVFALNGVWMDAPMSATVPYGGRKVPRSKFLSWAEAREMAHSGLVEFASHGYNLHRGVRANPQGSELAAAWARIYRPGRGYETESQFRERVAADLARSREFLARNLGKKPRILAWPFGRYNEAGRAVARDVGFQFAFTLDPDPANTADPMALARILPAYNPKLDEMADDLRFEDRLPPAQRLVALDPATVWTGNAAETDERLGRVLERLRTLGATGIVLEAAVIGEDGRLLGTWFPNGQLPLRADFLSRLAWQCQSRLGVKAYVRLPSSAALRTLGDPARVRALFRDLGAYVPLSGMFVDDAPGLARIGDGLSSLGMPWEVQAARKAAQPIGGPEALALAAFREVEFSRPTQQLCVVADPDQPTPGAIADLTLIPVAPEPARVARIAKQLGARGWLAPRNARRGGLWLISDKPPAASRLAACTREFQRRGGTAIGWSADDPLRDRPNAVAAGRTISAETFPIKF